MSGFFKAWAAYSGILIKLPSHALQGELATALFIYTMNLYDLLEKYTWNSVKGYHFQFQRKQVASGQSIFLPKEWRQLDSELIASKCFSHAIQRNPWGQHQSRPLAVTFPHRTNELPARDNIFGTSQNTQNRTSNPYSSIQGRRLIQYPIYPPSGTAATSLGQSQATPQACGNWNYRECRTINCRHLHICVSCGNGPKAVQCTIADSSHAHQAQASSHRPRR